MNFENFNNVLFKVSLDMSAIFRFGSNREELSVFSYQSNCLSTCM